MQKIRYGLLTFRTFGFPSWKLRKYHLGDRMKTILMAFAVALLVSPVAAGGLTEPAMDPAVVATETASSGDDNWVGVMMLVLVFGAAIAD